LAVGTLAVGMIFIGGTFLTGVYFTTVSTERTIASVAANEAFVKVRLFGRGITSQLRSDQCEDFSALVGLDPNELAYPSTREPFEQKQYFWSALCRLVEPTGSDRLVQVTVFVCRKAGRSMMYPSRKPWPGPVKVAVAALGGAGNQNKLRIVDPTQKEFFVDGCMIVDDRTGRLYRVLERLTGSADDTIILDRLWSGLLTPAAVWVAPPPPGGGRDPCIAVYQRLIRF